MESVVQGLHEQMASYRQEIMTDSSQGQSRCEKYGGDFTNVCAETPLMTRGTQSGPSLSKSSLDASEGPLDQSSLEQSKDWEEERQNKLLAAQMRREQLLATREKLVQKAKEAQSVACSTSVIRFTG